MPQAVGVNGAPQRREVEQLEAHGHHDPGDGEAGDHGPGALGLAVLVEAEPRPHDVLHDAAGHVGRHVVAVVPAPQLQVRDVRRVHGQAEQRPGAQDGAGAGLRAVEPPQPHRGVVHAVEDVGARGEVVELFGEEEVAAMEDGREDPARGADVRERLVEGPQRVRRGDAGADLGQPAGVRGQVAQREEDGQRLLHAQEPAEGPLAVELHDALLSGDAPPRHDVLACIVAFGRAVPEEETMEQGCLKKKSDRQHF